MENRYYLAIDIGASSGRHILAHKKDGRIVLEEIYRFPNGMQEHNGHKVWNVDQLFWEIQTGMKKCADIGKIPYSMGIDTWAVDFVLLDDQGQRIGDAVAYRDARTDGMDKQVYEIISENDLYEITGIQKQKFNTIYQLMALKQQNPESLDRAQSMLMIPDYFNFLLTGNKLQEYTNATTTQLVDPKANDWNWALIDRLGYPRTLFQTIMMAGSIVGNLADSIQKQVGFECKVVLPATHDTASAVMAVPSKEEQPLYISSGTWSLMGTELKEAACDEQSRKHNMTNEGGYDYRFRYLKNIMGLWMIQSVRKEIAPELGFGEISELASKQTIPSFVDANDPRFLAPEHMTSEVQKACKESGQQVPQGIAEVACVIYNSLAKCYADTAKEIEKLTGKTYDCIQIVGGGANADVPGGAHRVLAAHHHGGPQCFQNVLVAGAALGKDAGIEQVHVGGGDVLHRDQTFQLVVRCRHRQGVDLAVAHDLPRLAQAGGAGDAGHLAVVHITDLRVDIGTHPGRRDAEPLEHEFRLLVHPSGPAGLADEGACLIFQLCVSDGRADGVGVRVAMPDDHDLMGCLWHGFLPPLWVLSFLSVMPERRPDFSAPLHDAEKGGTLAAFIVTQDRRGVKWCRRAEILKF